MNASTAQARRVVLLSVLVLFAVNTYRGRLSTADVTVTKRLWGTGMLAVMLGFAADLAPQVAGPFAALIALSLFTKTGDAAFTNLLGHASGRVASGPTSGISSGAPAGATGGGGGSGSAARNSPQRSSTGR